MVIQYIECNSDEDGPKLQEFCNSIGIKRYYNNSPNKGRYWKIENNILIQCYVKGFDWNYATVLSFDDFKKLFKIKEPEVKEFYVKTTPEISEALQKMAFKVGYGWGGDKTVLYTDKEYIVFLSNKTIQYDANGTKQRGYRNIPVITVDEAIKILTVPPKPEVKIGAYTAQYSGDIVSIGCKSASKKEVAAVVKQIKAKKLQINGEMVRINFFDEKIHVGTNNLSFTEAEAVLKGFDQ